MRERYLDVSENEHHNNKKLCPSSFYMSMVSLLCVCLKKFFYKFCDDDDKVFGISKRFCFCVFFFVKKNIFERERERRNHC